MLYLKRSIIAVSVLVLVATLVHNHTKPDSFSLPDEGPPMYVKSGSVVISADSHKLLIAGKHKTLVAGEIKHRVGFTEADVVALALNLYFESRGENEQGLLAAAEVVINRVDDHRWPNTVEEVIYQPDQFSWTNDGLSDKPDDLKLYLEIYDFAYMVLSRSIDSNIVLDANHYHSVDVHPEWALSLDRVKRVGSHIFYKQ